MRSKYPDVSSNYVVTCDTMGTIYTASDKGQLKVNLYFIYLFNYIIVIVSCPVEIYFSINFCK